MCPNKDETAVHGCISYLSCSYLGEAGCAHVCRFLRNRGVEFGWFVLSTVLKYVRRYLQKKCQHKEFSIKHKIKCVRLKSLKKISETFNVKSEKAEKI